MINLVFVDDELRGSEKDHQDIWEHKFQKEGIKVKVEVYVSPNLWLANIATYTLNTIVILDLKMDEKSGMEVLHEIRKKGIYIPVIVYSATNESEIDYKELALDNSFTFIERSNVSGLIQAIKNAIKMLEDSIPLELGEALHEYLERRPTRKEQKILTKDGNEITFSEIVDEINKNSPIGIDYQKALYKMAFEALLDREKQL